MVRKIKVFDEVNANISKPIEVDLDSQSLSTDVGSVPAAVSGTCVATELGDKQIHKTILTLTDFPVTMRDTEQGGGVQIYDFPLGRILHLGSVATLAMTTTSVLANTLNTGVTCNFGVGTLTQSNATVTTTEQDLVNVAAWTAGTTIAVENTAASGVGAAVLASHDGSSTAINAFLNLAVAGGTDIDGNATITVTGSITINWINVGTY